LLCGYYQALVPVHSKKIQHGKHQVGSTVAHRIWQKKSIGQTEFLKQNASSNNIYDQSNLDQRKDERNFQEVTCCRTSMHLTLQLQFAEVLSSQPDFGLPCRAAARQVDGLRTSSTD
jgi:hypothetical protein